MACVTVGPGAALTNWTIHAGRQTGGHAAAFPLLRSIGIHSWE